MCNVGGLGLGIVTSHPKPSLLPAHPPNFLPPTHPPPIPLITLFDLINYTERFPTRHIKASTEMIY